MIEPEMSLVENLMTNGMIGRQNNLERGRVVAGRYRRVEFKYIK